MRIHFIAIGGSVMHNLAINLAKMGHQISGSDDQIVEPSRSKLKENGLLPEKIGWDADIVTNDLDAVILGKHAQANNPELLKAQELNIKIYSFPEFVYEQTLNKTRVVIAGTYGKTTIVSMIMHVLRKLERDFDYLVGAQLEGCDSLIKLSDSAPIILIEGDEFYASSIDDHAKFHYYHPNIALISNVHWDNFKMVISEENYLEQFVGFVETIVPKGTLIYNKDDKNVLKVIGDTKGCKINRHGYQLPAYTINKGVTSINVSEENIPLQVIGKQNLSNIAGAYTVCEWLGVNRMEFYAAIQDFTSSVRYLEFVASDGNSVVYQDFAHSPSKLVASIHAVKEQFPGHKLLTIIELNPYDVLDQYKMSQYNQSMDESDLSIVFVNKSTIRENNISLENLINSVKFNFNNDNLKVVVDVNELTDCVEKFDSQGFNMLFVSFNNYNGVNMLSFADGFFSKI